MTLPGREPEAHARAVVTGGASGIGAAVVERFLRRGITVAIMDMAPAPPPVDGVEYHRLDVTDADAVRDAFTELASTGPDPDVLVTCHGIRGAYVPAVELEPDTVRRVLDVHVMGTLLVATCFAKPLIDRGTPASVVTVSSTTAYGGWRRQADYGTAKAAVAQLTRNLAVEWAPSIRVNCVAPGHTLTPMVREMLDEGYDLTTTESRTPLGRMAAPDEMATAIEHLALDATFTTGVCLPVDGGWTAVGK